MQGNFNTLKTKKDHRKYHDERAEERKEYGGDKSKRTRQREEARRNKRDSRWNESGMS